MWPPVWTIGRTTLGLDAILTRTFWGQHPGHWHALLGPISKVVVYSDHQDFRSTVLEVVQIYPPHVIGPHRGDPDPVLDHVPG